MLTIYFFLILINLLSLIIKIYYFRNTFKVVEINNKLSKYLIIKLFASPRIKTSRADPVVFALVFPEGFGGRSQKTYSISYIFCDIY